MPKTQPLLHQAKQGNPDAIASLLNQRVGSHGICVTATLNQDCLNLTLEAEKIPPQAPLIKLIQNGMVALNVQAITTIIVNGKQLGQTLPAWTQEIVLVEKPSSVAVETEVVPEDSQNTQLSNPIASEIPKAPKRFPLKLALIGTGVSLVLVGIGGWLTWTRYQQAETIAQAMTLVETKNENSSSDITQLKVQQQNFTEAVAILNTIPNFLGSRYGNAQTQLRQIQSQLNAIDETLKAKAAENFSHAEQLGISIAATLSQLPQPANQLEETQSQLEEAITFLSAIPEDTPVFAQAQETLLTYQAQKTQLAQALAQEKQSADLFEKAKAAAIEAGKLSQNPPHSVQVWEHSAQKWQEAISHLEAIRPETSVYSDAQSRLASYRNNHNTINARRSAEQKAVESLESAKNLAKGAVNRTQNPPHAVAVWEQAQSQWQQAIHQLKAIPGGTTVSTEAQQKLSEYTQNLQVVSQALEKQKIADLMKELRPEAQAVADQFSALNSTLDVGMNYRQYGNQVRELKVALDRLGRQPYAKQLPVYQTLEDAFKKYDLAYSVWNYYIESDHTHNFFPASSPYGNTLIYTYGVQTRDIVGRRYIYLDEALSAIWAYAQNDVNKAQGQLSQS